MPLPNYSYKDTYAKRYGNYGERVMFDFIRKAP